MSDVATCDTATGIFMGAISFPRLTYNGFRILSPTYVIKLRSVEEPSTRFGVSTGAHQNKDDVAAGHGQSRRHSVGNDLFSHRQTSEQSETINCFDCVGGNWSFCVNSISVPWIAMLIRYLTYVRDNRPNLWRQPMWSRTLSNLWEQFPIFNLTFY